MLAVKKIVQIMTLFCVGSVLALSGCGGGADATGETVFIYVLNAYPGSSKLTLYGPTGKVASGLPYGQRTEEAVLVDRNTNSEEFLLLLDGAPTTIEFQKQLFSLYPQETATMVITRRSGEEEADVAIFRNTRTFSPTCMISFANSLSLDNNFLGQDFSFTYQTEWNIVDQTFYDASQETVAHTRCGPTKIRPKDVTTRGNVISGVNDDPWFHPVQGQDKGRYGLRWAVRTSDPRNPGERISMGLTTNGAVEAMRDSVEYVECMSAAVSVVQEENASDPGDSAASEECPDPLDGANLSAEQVVWDELAVMECHESLEYTGFPITPGSSQNVQTFEQGVRTVDGEFVCGYPIRVRTPLQDLIFQNRDSSIPNYVENLGGFVQVNVQYPISEHHYFVLFGRPVNPFVSQWNTGAQSVPYDGGNGEFPYPGDIVPSY